MPRDERPRHIFLLFSAKGIDKIYILCYNIHRNQENTRRKQQ
nr:MAG TPA: hypothetical protein [Caudoviricetes sp.]